MLSVSVSCRLHSRKVMVFLITRQLQQTRRHQQSPWPHEVECWVNVPDKAIFQLLLLEVKVS